MPYGPGKYGANAENLLEQFHGQLCLVLMFGGPHGPSFDVATVNPEWMAALPAVLRKLADAIEADLCPREES